MWNAYFAAGHTIQIEHACARTQTKSGTEGCTAFESHQLGKVEEAQRLAPSSAGMSRRESRRHRSTYRPEVDGEKPSKPLQRP